MKESFEELYTTYHSKVYTLCLRLLKSHEDAEDAVQRVFLSIWLKLSTFRGESAFGTWLYRVTVNECLMFLRRRPKIELVELKDAVDVASKSYPERVVDVALQQGLRKLAKGYRRAILVRDAFGFEYNEAGRLLHCHSGTIKSQRSKGIAKLRGIMKPKLGRRAA